MDVHATVTRGRSHPAISAFGVGVGVLAAAVLLAACGGGSSPGSGSGSTPTPTPGTSAAAGTGAGRANGLGGTPPAATGQIAEIDGNTVQVQSQQNGQVAVDVSRTTTYSQTKATTFASVQVGECVVATKPTTGTASGQPQPTSITATEVVITQAAGGSCTRGGFGGGGFGGARPSGAPTDRPTQLPSGLPSGRASGTRTVTAVAVAGEVTAVSGSTITVKGERRASGSSTPTPMTGTVTVTSSTKYTETVTANQAAMKVGLCMTAFGTTSSDGTVAASRVALSPPSSTGCDTGLRRFGGFGGGGGGQGSGSTGG